MTHTHRIARNSRKLSDFTYHSKKMICFSGGGKAVFWFSEHISTSRGFGFATGKFTNFSACLVLEHTPLTGLIDITEVFGGFFKKEEKKVFEILQLHELSVFYVTSTEVQAGLLFSALRWQKLKNLRGQSQICLRSKIYLLTKKRLLCLLKNILFE